MSLGRWLGSAAGAIGGSFIPIPGVGTKLGSMIGSTLGSGIGGLLGGKVHNSISGGGNPMQQMQQSGPGSSGWDAMISPFASQQVTQNPFLNQQAAENNYTFTPDGSPVANNPHLPDLYNAAARPVIDSFQSDIMPSIGSQFANFGGLGGSAHALASGRAAGLHSGALADMSARLYGTNFENELQRRFMSNESGLQRQFQADQAGMDRQFNAYEALLGRQYGATEGGLNRQMQAGSAAYQGMAPQRSWGNTFQEDIVPGLLGGGLNILGNFLDHKYGWSGGSGGGGSPITNIWQGSGGVT